MFCRITNFKLKKNIFDINKKTEFGFNYVTELGLLIVYVS